MSTKLIRLSIAAFAKAEERGVSVPSEMYEFSHLPMTMFDGLPVFDGARMRPDQVEDLVDRLELIAGDRFSDNLAEAVAQYMEAYGRFGLRLQDLMDAVSGSKPAVLKHLRRLVDAGQVRIQEEQTRGAGSKRKRYFWCDNAAEYGSEDIYLDEDESWTDLRIQNDGVSGYMNGDSGIIHHGAAVDGLRCPCSSCQFALQEVFDAEARSAARQRGETGFAVGLQARRVLRERAEAKFTKEFQAALVELAALQARKNNDQAHNFTGRGGRTHDA